MNDYEAVLERIEANSDYRNYIDTWARRRFAEFFRKPVEEFKDVPFDGSAGISNLENLAKKIDSSYETAKRYYELVIKLTDENA
jgi:hypothetical protein